VSAPILVGYQPSGADQAPVELGVAAARFTGAPLVIAAVAGRGNDLLEEEAAGDRSGALAELRRELDIEGVDVDTRVLHGRSAPQALHEAAEELGAGLLVVGSTSRGAVGRLLPGSTATRLMHGAPCPIAVVPCGWKAGGGLHTIGVAFIDTPEARDALDGAAALARRAGAKLRVLTAVRPQGLTAAYGGGDPMTPPITYEELASVIRTAAEHAVADVLAGEGDGLDAELDVSVGEPGEFLAAASRHLDLLVCGSRGYGPRRAVLLGGVSRQVTTEAACPVIVLPRGVQGSLQTLAGAAVSGS
jgi:nucleotide-binding universal stress UspA family protein